MSGRGNASTGESLIGVQALECGHSAIEEIDYLVPVAVQPGIAASRKGVDTCSMLIPLVLPEVLVRARIWQPICIHVL